MDQFRLEVAFRSLEAQERSIVRIVERAGRYLAISITITVSFILATGMALPTLLAWGAGVLVFMTLLALAIYAAIDNGRTITILPGPSPELWKADYEVVRTYATRMREHNLGIMERDGRNLRHLQTIVAVQLVLALFLAVAVLATS